MSRSKPILISQLFADLVFVNIAVQCISICYIFYGNLSNIVGGSYCMIKLINKITFTVIIMVALGIFIKCKNQGKCQRSLRMIQGTLEEAWSVDNCFLRVSLPQLFTRIFQINLSLPDGIRDNDYTLALWLVFTLTLINKKMYWIGLRLVWNEFPLLPFHSLCYCMRILICIVIIFLSNYFSRNSYYWENICQLLQQLQ